MFEEARTLERPGTFAVVLEAMPSTLAAAITAELKIPTIGIGAGPGCDEQVLVSYDAFGLFNTFVPKLVKQYAKLGDTITEAIKQYIAEVQDGRFPISIN